MTLFYLKQYGNVFEVRISSNQDLNAWQGRVILPSDVAVKSVVYGESVGDIWQTPPTFVAGRIDFSGGRTSPWTGDGLLFRFTATAKNPGNPPVAQLIRFDAAATGAYLADGQGSVAPATLQPITINVKDLLSTTTSLPVLPGDVPPEPFAINVVQDPAIFGGRPAIIFSTVDAGVGIDHYEVKEQTSRGSIGWHTATSPYLVDSEAIKIYVRAIDRNGNFRDESIVLRQNLPVGLLVAIVLALALAAALAARFMKQWRKKR